MDQFNSGKPWTYDPSADNTIIGGHDVRILGVHADGTMDVATWGKIQQMSPDFLAHYAEEAWSEASQEIISAHAAPNGLSVVALNAAYTQVTGDPGPFQDTPVPTPPSPPAPVVSPADQVLAAAIPARWLARPGMRFRDTAKVAQALQGWLTATGQRPSAHKHEMLR